MDGRLKKSKRNLYYGIIYQISYVVLNFITRLVMIYSIGMTSVSLNGLFSEVLSVLSLAELGIGSAITYSLYIPLALNDTKKVTQIMNLFKTSYRIIAGVIASIGLLMIPFIPYLITNTVINERYLISVYLLFLIQTAASYLFSYKAALLNADQKSYVISKRTMFVRFVFFILNIGCLFLFRNFMLYLFLDIMQTFAINIFISKKVDQIYPYVKEKDRLTKDEQKAIFSNVKHLFIGNLSGKITNSSDNILISLLVGTNCIGPYSQYSMIINGIMRLFTQASNSITGSVGNLLATEKSIKCQQIFENITFVFFLAGSICACCFYVMITPFLSVFIRNEYVLSDFIVCILSINMFVSILKMPLWTFVSASGLFKLDKYISIIGSSLNLFVSIILGLEYGIAGIFLGTFISLFIQSILKLCLFYKSFLKNSPKKFFIRWGLYITLCIAEFMISRFLANRISFSYIIPDFIIKASLSTAIPIIINIAIFNQTREYSYWHNMISSKLRLRFCLRNQKNSI